MKYTIGFLSVSKLVICNIEMLHEKYDIFCLASSRPKVLLALPGQKCFAYTLQYIFRLVCQNIFFPFYFKVTSTANITIAYFILPNSLPLFKIRSKCYELFAHTPISRFFDKKMNFFPFTFKVTSTANITICCGCLNMEVFHPNRITSS